VGKLDVVKDLAELNRDIEQRVMAALQGGGKDKSSCCVMHDSRLTIAVDRRFATKLLVRARSASNNEAHLTALFDTGSDHTIIRKAELSQAAPCAEITSFNGQSPLHGGNEPMVVLGIVALNLVVTKDTLLPIEALVVENLPVPMIVGMDFISKEVKCMHVSRGVIELKESNVFLMSTSISKTGFGLEPVLSKTNAKEKNFVEACESVTIQPNSVGYVRVLPRSSLSYADFIVEPLDPFACRTSVRLVAQTNRVYSRSKRPRLMSAVMNYGEKAAKVVKGQKLGFISGAVTCVRLDQHVSEISLPILWDDVQLTKEAIAYVKFWDKELRPLSHQGAKLPIRDVAVLYGEYGKECELLGQIHNLSMTHRVYVCIPASYGGALGPWLNGQSECSFLLPRNKTMSWFQKGAQVSTAMTPFWEAKVHGLKDDVCKELVVPQEHNSMICVIQEDETRQQKDAENQLQSDKLYAKVEKEIQEITWPHLSDEQSHSLRAVLMKHSAVFEDRLGRVKAYKHTIEVTQAKPVFRPPSRRSEEEKKLEREEVAKMLEQGAIKPGRSPWGFPNVIVKKADGGWRVTTNFRALNAITKKDQYPLPRVEDVLAQLAGQKYFSSLDCRTGYWQIELDDAAKEMCAMVTSEGSYLYQVMPMGMINSTATFQRLMDVILGHLKRQACLAYVDDVTVLGSTFDEHLKHLDEVLLRLEESGMTLKLSKCVFMQVELIHLGHIVTAEGIMPSSKLVEKIRSWDSNLKSAEEVQRFLGMVLFFSRFIPNFSDRTKHLREVLKGSGCNAKRRYKGERLPNDPKWDQKWTEAHVSEVEDLKNALCKEPVMLYHPDLNFPFVVETDASGAQLGSILMQKKNGTLRVVAYHSRVMKDAETRYSVTEQECLAVIDAIGRWRHYLHGTRFTVVTDHSALKWLLGLTESTGRIARWIVKLNDYDFEVQIRPGKDHVVADALSRARMVNAATTNEANVGLRALVTRSQTRPAEVSDSHIVARRDVGVFDMPTLDEVATEQRCDEEWKPVVTALESKNENLPEYRRWLEDYMVREDGVLVRQSKWLRLGVVVEREQVVIPETFVEAVLAVMHMSRVGGHFGVTRTYYKLCEYYWWPRMRQDVYRYVTNCHICISNSRLSPKKAERAPLQTYDVSRRFQIVMVDLLGGLPSTAQGNKSILVLTDAFTKYTSCVALPSTTAEVVAQAILDEWVMRFGPPESLLSDRGVQFTGRVVEHMCLMLGIKKIFTTAYHPETDGQTERFNSSLLKLLRVYCDGNQANWDVWLQSCCFVYNTSMHATIRMSPYELMFGAKAPEFFELAAMWKVRNEGRDVGDASNKEQCWAQKLNAVIRTASALAYKYTWKSKDDYARYHDAKLLARRVDEHGDPVGPEWARGSLVYIWTPRAAYQGTTKLTPQWVGPYRIEKVLNPVNVMVTDVKTGLQIRVHVNRLRKVSDDVIEVSNIPLVDHGGLLPSGYHIIDRIVSRRQRPGMVIEYKVKWMDRSHSWEAENLLPETLIWDFKVASTTRAELDQEMDVELESQAPIKTRQIKSRPRSAQN
jgi:hypothetical protein